MKFAVMAGSLRKDSLNKKLSREIVRFLSEAKQEGLFLDLKEFEIPIYDGDVESSTGIPAGVQKLDAAIRSAQALIIVTPEYNGSIPGVLKNTVDWLSRIDDQCLRGKDTLIFAASPGALGGVRSLWHSRVPFEVLGARVYPDMLGTPRADTIFGADGKITDIKTEDRIKKLLTSFISLVQKTNG